mgnify:CR=1 FL=1
MCNPGKVYSREELLRFVWGNRAAAGGDVRTVDVHVRRLREKIEPSPSDPKYVHTKWGVGTTSGFGNVEKNSEEDERGAAGECVSRQQLFFL